MAHIAGLNAGVTEVHGPEGVRGVVRLFGAAFPDLQATIEDQVAEGDKVANLVRFTGTHEGELMGIPPTGKQVTVDLCVVQYFSGDKISAVRSLVDEAARYRLTGADA